MKAIIAICFVLNTGLFALAIENHLKKIERKSQPPQIKNIDFIYLINLDQRPEKLERISNDFARFGIELFRFPAIYGWQLPRTTFDDLGVVFQPWMMEEVNFQINYNGFVLIDPKTTAHPDTGEYHRLGPKFYQRNVFSVSMKGGAIGCTLSHLSILQDALDSGYHAVWILEDDTMICEDPHQLGDWIDRLDESVGREGWDILYTDSVVYFHSTNDINWIWRPDLAIDYNQMLQVKDLGSFLQIGGRGHTHSMILSRAGMEKILGFEKTHGIFNPYDMELATIPGIRLFALKQNIVIQNQTVSDTVRQIFD